ncbi:MAG: hypothetical protein GWO87_01225 [Xanthomonadaceae bacterium]|nr:hypothetical protein [Rhodospirillaceae bacterium]NIA17797.1 hypothetical protein [Xanthomonadaceae bacterium]
MAEETVGFFRIKFSLGKKDKDTIEWLKLNILECLDDNIERIKEIFS